MTAPTDPHLASRKWIDPSSDSRFDEARLSEGSSTEALLADIVLLCDQLFDHLSVFEQFAETTSRGATHNPRLRTDFPNVRARLARARGDLERALTEVYAARPAFVQDQLERLNLTGDSHRMLHIGCGSTRLDGWTNLDVGGGDLTANVNWGLPFPDNSVSFIYAAHVLEHLRYVDQAPRFVREARRVLRPGGVARFVVPDVGRLLEAYVHRDAEYFAARQLIYPVAEGFLVDGMPSLDYLLLFCGASSQVLNLNHKFGYDSITLPRFLIAAGFAHAYRSGFQDSRHPELHVDDKGFNAPATGVGHEHFSLFVEAVK